MDSEHHAGGLVADGVSGDTLIAAAVGRAHVLDLQIAIGANVELAALCHLHTILGEAREEGRGQGVKVMTLGDSVW